MVQTLCGILNETLLHNYYSLKICRLETSPAVCLVSDVFYVFKCYAATDIIHPKSCFMSYLRIVPTCITVMQRVLFPLHHSTPMLFLLIMNKHSFTRLRVARAKCASSKAKYKTVLRVGVMVLYVLTNWHLQWLFVLPTEACTFIIRQYACVWVCGCLFTWGMSHFQRGSRVGGSWISKVAAVLLWSMPLYYCISF